MRDVFFGTYCDACVEAHDLTGFIGVSAEQWVALPDAHPAVVAVEAIPLETHCAGCVAQAARR